MRSSGPRAEAGAAPSVISCPRSSPSGHRKERRASHPLTGRTSHRPCDLWVSIAVARTTRPSAASNTVSPLSSVSPSRRPSVDTARKVPMDCNFTAHNSPVPATRSRAVSSGFLLLPVAYNRRPSGERRSAAQVGLVDQQARMFVADQVVTPRDVRRRGRVGDPRQEPAVG